MGVARGVSFHHFDTGEVPAEHDAPVRVTPVAGLEQGFRFSVDVLRVGDVSIVELRCGASVGSWRHAEAEQNDLLRMVFFHRAARVVGHWHGRRVRLRDGWPALVGRTGGGWYARMGFHAMQITVPRGRLPVQDAVLDRITERQLRPDHPVFDALLRPPLTGMVGRLRELSRTATADLATVWVALVSLLVGALSAEATEPVRLSAVHRYIEANLSDPGLGPESVAAAFHLSRRALYYLMPGEGIAATIRRARLLRARTLLTDPELRTWPIARIATEAGLPGGAQFSRLFRAEFGESPRDFRARMARR